MNPEVLLEQGSQRLVLLRNYCEPSFFQLLHEAISWRQNRIILFGRAHDEPRLTAWYGPPYTYSRIAWPPQAFIAPLEALRIRLVSDFNFPFNACLCNLYRHGNDSMGWHSDDEPEMDTTLIASISLGAERTFKVRHRQSREAYSFPLPAGSVLLMQHFQQLWQHCITKTSRQVGPRLNLTFRHIVSVAG